jgi:hypothetical protein
MNARNKIPRTITKTLGDGTEIEVPNSDFYDNDGMFHKQRFVPSNVTPKKKKRKR